MLKNWKIDVLLQTTARGIVNPDGVAAILEKALIELESEIDARVVKRLSVLFTGDSEIKLLNAHYRGKDTPTDVLSFSMLEGDDSGPRTSLGDIVISIDTARRQAEDLQVSLEEELLRLLLHGLLHLLGFDHENVSEKEVLRMQAAEDALYNLLLPEKDSLIL
ncbi:MAG: rRNA maturation RNase YbeY [Candidatus Dadabacteria bacterium]|nr:MAG: rRNA maturation RNase YbeY [Candidatus Dadabacteria bacterium]